MNAELKTTFLNIFEGNYRESIVTHLKRQYQALSSKNKSEYRVNPKFIATEVNPFEGNVVKVLNPHVAICDKGQGRYVAILNNSNVQVTQVNLKVADLQGFGGCVLSEDGKILFVIYNENRFLVVDMDTKNLIHQEKIPGAMNVIVNDRSIYFDGISKEIGVRYKIQKLYNRIYRGDY
jgi:hypothetical protein